MDSNMVICCPIWYLHASNPIDFPLCENALEAIMNDHIQACQRVLEQRTAFLDHARSHTLTLLEAQALASQDPTWLQREAAKTEQHLHEHAVVSQGLETLLQQCQAHEYRFGEQAEATTWVADLQEYYQALGVRLASRVQVLGSVWTPLPKEDLENYETQEYAEPVPLLPTPEQQLREELRADSVVEGRANTLDSYTGPPIGTPTRTVHIDEYGTEQSHNGGVSPYATSAWHKSLQQKWVALSPWNCVTRICLNRECETCSPDHVDRHDSVLQSEESEGEEGKVSDSEEAVVVPESSEETVWQESGPWDFEGDWEDVSDGEEAVAVLEDSEEDVWQDVEGSEEEVSDGEEEVVVLERSAEGDLQQEAVNKDVECRAEWISTRDEEVAVLERSEEDLQQEAVNGDVEGRAEWISTRERFMC